MIVEADLWASAGIEELVDEHVRDEKPFTEEEVGALVRAAYGCGYIAAHSEPAPLPIIDACSYAATLRLTLPSS